MAKLKYLSHNVSCVVDPKLLIYKWAKAKQNVDLELQYETSLLKVDPEDTKEEAWIDNLVSRPESQVKIFKAVHFEYVEKIKSTQLDARRRWI